jgi:hypothetical protein
LSIADKERTAAIARMDLALAKFDVMERNILKLMEEMGQRHDDHIEASRQHLSQFWDALKLREMRAALREIKEALER